jgi:hypothetical protein
MAGDIQLLGKMADDLFRDLSTRTGESAFILKKLEHHCEADS